MSYADLYLEYLDQEDIYQNIYEDLAFKIFAEALTPQQLRAAIGKEQNYLDQLVQQKARFADNPQVVAAIDAKIKASGASLGKLKGHLAKSPEGNIPAQPAGAPTQADIPAAPVPAGTPTTTAGELTRQKAAATRDLAATGPQAGMGPGGSGAGAVVPGTEKQLQAAQGAPKELPGATPGAPSAKAVAQNKQAVDMTPDPRDMPVPGGDVSTMGQVKQTAADTLEKGKELGAKGLEKGKELATQAGEKIKAADTAVKDVLPQGAQQALDTAGTAAGQTAQTVAGKLGAGADTAGAVGQAAQAVASSPLGLAALGGAAAYGGYKLYKRFLSKSATACKGYSGPDKTACMKSYMDAKRNQGQVRGAATPA